MPEAPSEVRRPPSLMAALAVLAIETVAMVGLTLFLLYEDLFAATPTLIAAFGVTLFAALLGGLLALFTWSLWRGRAWARGPALVLQLLLVPIGYYMLTGGLPGLGVPVIAIGLAGAVALIAPPTRAALD